MHQEPTCQALQMPQRLGSPGPRRLSSSVAPGSPSMCATPIESRMPSGLVAGVYRSIPPSKYLHDRPEALRPPVLRIRLEPDAGQIAVVNRPAAGRLQPRDQAGLPQGRRRLLLPGQCAPALDGTPTRPIRRITLPLRLSRRVL